MKVTFNSNNNVLAYSGFHATFYAVNCGGKISASNGILTSPNYPSNYFNNATCVWNITVPMGNVVQLKFAANSQTESGYDYVSAYDGASGTALGAYVNIQEQHTAEIFHLNHLSI